MIFIVFFLLLITWYILLFRRKKLYFRFILITFPICTFIAMLIELLIKLSACIYPINHCLMVTFVGSFITSIGMFVAVSAMWLPIFRKSLLKMGIGW